MPATIRNDYVVEIELEHQQEVETQEFSTDGSSFIDLPEFTKRYLKQFPESKEDEASKYWHSLFGSNPDIMDDDNYTQARYLTDESCEQILLNAPLFKSGLDYEHLPRGFFLTKKPGHESATNVLHYSSFIAEKQTQPSPLSITLSKKGIEETKTSDEKQFPVPQINWYKFLLSKITSKDGKNIYCTPEELKKAFIAFSNTVHKLNLSFYEPDFASLTDDFNPIVLLGRWDTVLNNNNLKPADINTQWQHLPHLTLSKSYGALRAISDYQYTETPCGFVLPTMFQDKPIVRQRRGWDFYFDDEKEQPYGKFSKVNHVAQAENIDTTLDFWRYISYQPKRNSIEFYNKALKTLETMKFEDGSEMEMKKLLLGSTTGIGHQAENPLAEEEELKIWSSLCNLVNNITTLNATMRLFSKLNGGDRLKREFIHHLSRLKPKPSMQLLNSIAIYISGYLGKLNLLVDGTKTMAGGDPLNKLTELSDQLNNLIRTHDLSFTLGYRFYFVNGKWPNNFDVASYTHLQHHLDEQFRRSRFPLEIIKTFISTLSTFTITNNKEIDEINHQLAHMGNHYLLALCLTFFKNVQKPLTFRHLAILMNFIKEMPEQNSLTPALNFLEKEFKEFFPENYFPAKRKELEERANGINQEQIDHILGLKLSPEACPDLIRIESSLVRLSYTNKDLNELHNQIIKLKSSLSNEEFHSYLKKLESIKDFLPKDKNELFTLNNIICRKRNLESFNQIYYRNIIENCNDSSLIFKISYFIEKIKPLSKGKRAINLLTLQEQLAGFVLNSNLADLNDKNYSPKIEKFIDALDIILKAHPHIQEHLLTTIKNIPAKNSKEYLQTLVELGECLRTMTSVLPTGEHKNTKQHMTAIFALFANFKNTPIELIKLNTQLKSFATVQKRQTILTLAASLIKDEKTMQDFFLLLNHLKDDYLFNIFTSQCSKPPYPAISVINDWLKETKVEIDLIKEANSKKIFSEIKFDENISKPLPELIAILGKNTDLIEKVKAIAPIKQQFLLHIATNILKKNTEEFIELIAKLDLKEDITYLKLKKYYPFLFSKDIKPDIELPEENAFTKKYQAFSQTPFGPRRLNYTFDRNKFNKQKTKFGTSKHFFNDSVRDKLNIQLNKNRMLTLTELQNNYNDLKAKGYLTRVEDKMALLCLCIEMLARTTSQLDGVPPVLISQELNTTQVMALYAMIMNKEQNISSQIDTGEGKSRISMVLAAFKASQGYTVDFLTSDMALAERDYLSYNAFFNSLDIKTGLISLNTPKQLYQIGGVNFSDSSQLVLLRNKSDISLDPYAYLDKNERNRCTLIDEQDKLVNDKSKDAYNYAARSKKLMSFVWVYPLLVKYVEAELQKNKDFDVKNKTADFLNYVARFDFDSMHQSSLAELSISDPIQIPTWLESAKTALSMRVDKDYKMSEDKPSEYVPVRDSDGHTRYTRKIIVLDTGRPSEGSTFSEGIHQCLCALENIRAGREQFIILPENETLRSSYPASFLDQYSEGYVYGVSGTIRTPDPLKVPRHKDLIREDKQVWAAKDQEQQLAYFKEYILEKLSKNLPILLICKDDQQSKVFFDKLSKDPDIKGKMANCTRVHALTKKEDEVKAIENAGKPGHLTISTVGMFGRGVDVNAENLTVLCAYVPPIEDEQQIKGRTARSGKPGEYRMIIDLSDPDCPINGKTNNLEREVAKAQHEMSVSAVSQEEINRLYSAFLENVHQNFLKSYRNKTPIEQNKCLKLWANYLDSLNKNWTKKRPALLEAMQQTDKSDFIVLFKKFISQWEAKIPGVVEVKRFDAQEKASDIYEKLVVNKRRAAPLNELKVQKDFDRSDAGQARIYSSFFAQERAILRGERSLFADYYAWKEGRGDLFPDLMATLRGERPLFATLRATISKLATAIKNYFVVAPVENDMESPSEKREDKGERKRNR